MWTPSSSGRPPQSVIYSDAVLERFRRRFGFVPEYVEEKLYWRCKRDMKRRWRKLW